MAKTSSAKKAKRSSLRKRVFNARRKRTMHDAIKGLSKLIAIKNGKDAVTLLPAAYQAIDKAAKRGVIKANTAARMKSRLSKRLRGVS